MDPVTSADIGSIALDRLIRERLVVLISPGFAAPLDLPVTPEDRASTLRPYVPSHTVASGLGGQWILMGGSRPTDLDLVGVRGLHRAPPGFHPPGWTLRFHSGRAADEPAGVIAGVRVASLSRCLSDGLRWGPLAEAIPATLRAIRADRVTQREVASRVLAENPRGLGTARLRSAWAAIERALA